MLRYGLLSLLLLLLLKMRMLEMLVHLQELLLCC